MKVDSKGATGAAQRASEKKLVTENVYLFPLTFAQQRLWFLDQLQPGTASYMVPWSIRMTGKLDAPALERSLNEIVRRHEVLRTTFSVSDGQPVQVVSPSLQVPLPVVDLSGSPEREDAARRATFEEAKTPLDLKNGPLVRARLLRLAPDEHVLLLTLHHIIFDGWSRRILVRELAALYEAFCAGQPSPLPDLPLQYADYAVWQRKHLQGKLLDKQLAYWKQQLAEAPATLDLPTDRPRPAVQSFRGAVKAFALPLDLTENLNRLSRQEGATLFMTLLAGFQALLARYSGQDDIVVGAPIANRNRAELEGLIGFFANTLALRTQFSGDPSFRELLGRVKESALGAYAHQDMPFEKLVEELQPERSLSHNPLFQVLFSLQNAARQAFELAGLELKPLDNTSETSKFDISLYLVESAEGLRGRVEYNTDLFDVATIERMLGHYQQLLEAAVADPTLPVSRLPLLSANERQQLLFDWNATEFDYPRQHCLHQEFEAQAARAPQAVACVCGEQSLTYGQLNARANQVTHFLKQHGVGPGERVGIFVERSLDMMVGLLGIQKSGAAYVPLDPSYPEERLRLTLDDAQVRVLLTQQSLLSSMPSHQAEVVCLDRDWPAISQHSASNFDSGVTPEDLVYVIFTSGSTGRPKGVQVPHRAVVNLLRFMGQELRMGPDDVFPALASFAFDMCIPELYLALVTGGRVVIGNRHLAANGEELAALLRKQHASIVHATPTTWSLLLEAGFTGKGLKRVIGAEPLPRELCTRLLTADSSLYNFYGPTETTVWSAFHHFTTPDEAIVVGRPLANTQIYILDKNLQPVPVGVPGEIHIAGDGVTCGYLNRPELTAEKFIADPFAPKPNAKMYKTGDLGRYLADGRIEFQGRVDHQVKVRGYRIELGEIETVLGQHASVQDCVVIAREDTPGDKRLVGYVVAAAEQKINSSDLRAWVKSRLPEYMVPVAVVEMERLPLSPNGKVDRKHLPAPDYTRPELAGEYQQARTPAEEVIAGVWAEVLKLDTVGVHDDFFALGGHSLLATQVVSRIRQAFQVELPLRSLFEAPTVAGLAERVEALQREQHGLQAPPLVPVKRESAMPLSFAQQRLWFLDQLEPNNPLYNVPHIVRMAGKLNVAVLEKSLQEIVRRHETLRTRFQTVDDQPAQVIAAELTLPLAVTDLREIPDAEREARAKQLAMDEVKRPFTLATGPLLRASLLVLGDEDHVLILNTHHIISDRWSLGVLSQELAALYQAFLQGQPSPLPELPIQYADYAVWQRQFLSAETLNKQLAYWKQQLAGAPASLGLPTDRPRPPVQTYRGAQQSVVLSKTLLESLKQLSRSEGVTLFMTLLAAFDVLLSRYSGQQDVVVGSPIAGRNRAEVEKLIGFFVNTLVLRTDLSDNPTFRELLPRVRETAMGAYAHQELPFEKLVEDLRPERDLSRNPLFQVMLILQNAPTAGQAMADVTVSGFPVSGQSAKFDLMLIASERADGLRATFEYNCDLFDSSTIERMLGHLQVLLESIASDPKQQISALTILPAGEHLQLVADWNATEQDYPRELCLHDMFAQTAGKQPQRMAAICDNRQISYGELHARSNRLARYLQEQGVGPEVLVGLVMERSLDMLVALLGILKAGGAYVPLDPAYPKDRIGFILQDAQAPVVVTQASLAGMVAESSARCVLIDSDWPLIAHESSSDLTSRVSPEQLAYVLYTSGSTGKPKGVQIEHRNLVNFLTSMQKQPGLTADDTLVAVTTLSFDIAGLELYLPLICGAKIVLASREQAADGIQLQTLLSSTNATVMQATPATWRMLLESGWRGTQNLRALCGGEALPAALARQLLPCCGELWNMYGPTETTIWSSVYRVQSDLTSTAPIGRPIANTSMYVLDPQQQPVPIGVAGELYIGGDGVARGYLNRPELTAEKFIADSFAAKTGARLYRTGDLARYLPDGNIQFLGRADFQVKIRGFRIELGEIESVLARHPAVQQAVVAVREDIPGDQRLVGYVVGKGNQEVISADLKTHLKQSLPEYMVPSVLVTLSSLPLTPNGKVDRRALPAPDASLLPTEEMVAPRNAVEQTIAEIWQEVLRLPAVSMQANFFELGGHSLLATQVVSRIHKQLGIALPVRSLFEHATIAGLAEAIAAQGVAGVAERSIPRRPRSAGPAPQRFALSFAQQRLWVLDQLEPESAAYNIPISMRLTGRLNAAALETAINEVVRRHEVLRTQFALENGEPVQLVLPSARVSLSAVDLMDCPPTERQARALQLATKETSKPFDLKCAPLLRAMLLHLADSEHIFVLTVHHIALDGWSIGTLLSEIVTAYTAALAGQPSPAPDLPLQYADFAAWQRETLRGEELERQLSYWKNHLLGAPASIDLPTDRPRPPEQTFHGDSYQLAIERQTLERLNDLSRRQGATLFMTLLAAFNILLQRYSGQDDIVIGTPLAGRNRPELEKLIGLFVNTLVLRTDLSGDPTFFEQLGRVRQAAFGAYAHQDLPFERLVEELKPERDLSRNPLFQVMFILQNTPRNALQMPGVTSTPFKIANESEKFDLSVNLFETAGGLRATFGYNRDLFEASTIARMAGHFQKLLEEVAANPERRISELPLLAVEEKHRLLVEFNDTAVATTLDACVHQRFEEQAARTPHAIAVVCGDQRIAYAELNQRANQLAHLLQKRGVGPDVLVGICLERSVDLLVAVLATWKAGGAYVPLDPAFPKDRLGYIVEDANAAILLTQSGLEDVLPAHSARTIYLDQPAAESDASDPTSSAKPNHLAYVLYTSGSTGKPKGVQIEHRNLMNFLSSMQKQPGMASDGVLLAVTTLSFDIAGLELYLPLLTGATVALATREQASDGHELVTLMDRSHATLMQATPATWRMMLEVGWKGNKRLKILCGGEPLTADLANQLRPRCSELWNMYGPTETTIWSSLYRVEGDLEKTASIGRPIANTTMYVLDARRQPVPIGVRGELYIGGAGVARGYLNRPDLTAEKFVADPFQPGARLYRTGDLAAYLPDGNLQFLGRADFQVKVRGFRIELEEIEAVLARHPAVEQGVVAVREDRPGDMRLVGYVVPKSGQEPGNSDLRAHLEQSLPDYMVPGLFVKLESLPLTPNGKINRRALPAPDWSHVDTAGKGTAKDGLESMLLKLWRSVLGIPTMGVEDNFFDFGGHSLLAVRLLSEVEKVVGRRIPLATLFRGATVQSLAKLIREDSLSDPEPLVMEIQAGNGGLPFFAIASPGVRALGFALLARHMGEDQAVYKVQANSGKLVGRPYTAEEIRTLAEQYVAAMRVVQPQGPYCLGGMCGGVQIGEQMVIQLEAAGQEVGLFAIFDTWVIQNTQKRWHWRLAYYQQRLRSLRNASLSEQLQQYKHAIQTRIRRWTGKERTPTAWRQVYWPEKFTPTRFQAPIALFKRPKQPFYYVDDPQMGWGNRSDGGVEIHEVEFDHSQILREPFVRVLGEKLIKCLQRVSRQTQKATQAAHVDEASHSTMSVAASDNP